MGPHALDPPKFSIKFLAPRIHHNFNIFKHDQSTAEQTTNYTLTFHRHNLIVIKQYDKFLCPLFKHGRTTHMDNGVKREGKLFIQPHHTIIQKRICLILLYSQSS